MYSSDCRGTPFATPIPIQPHGMPMDENALVPRDEITQKNLLHSLLETRRSWKTRDTGESIWSIHLETALLEGLQQYRPTPCRDTLMLGRFPYRNQFISEYIWRKTGQRRTPKQVGSRLQQLRESSLGQELHDLLFPSPQSIIDRALLSVNVSHPTHEISFPPGPHHAIVIDILPRWVPEPPPIEVPLRPWSETNNNITHVSRFPRGIGYIDPTVTLVSRSTILAQSKFTVCTEEGTVHVETVTLKSMPSPAGVLHRTTLVPGYWKTIVESSDPTRYTIFQEVTLADDCRIVFSATYNFAYSPQYSKGLRSPSDFTFNGDINISHQY
ncbi:hypothetical protein C8R44DRAFT_924328, partial [Mycena epipterygia]